MAKENIIVLSAHSDDFVLGAGGTIANYASEGRNVHAIVFSYGEKSHPWMKKHLVKRMREQEARAAGKILGCTVHFFELEEFKFLETYKEKGVDTAIQDFITKFRPAKIFTHSREDPHPDHRAVNTITLELYDSLHGSKPEVYVYSIWNPVSFRTSYPALYVDVSGTFSTKLKALKKFQSQRIHIIYPFLLLLFRAVKDGFHIGKKCGEHFFKIR